jgi:hypothetical protein
LEAHHVNMTQQLLDTASAERAYLGQLETIAVREAIRPLERRRQHALAELVRQQGRCRRAA